MLLCPSHLKSSFIFLFISIFYFRFTQTTQQTNRRDVRNIIQLFTNFNCAVVVQSDWSTKAAATNRLYSIHLSVSSLNCSPANYKCEDVAIVACDDSIGDEDWRTTTLPSNFNECENFINTNTKTISRYSSFVGDLNLLVGTPAECIATAFCYSQNFKNDKRAAKTKEATNSKLNEIHFVSN